MSPGSNSRRRQLTIEVEFILFVPNPGLESDGVAQMNNLGVVRIGGCVSPMPMVGSASLPMPRLVSTQTSINEDAQACSLESIN